MSRKPYIATVKEVLETSDPFPQLVKLTEGSKNMAEVLKNLSDANVPTSGPTILSTVRAEMAKGIGKNRVRKTSDLFRIASKVPRVRRTKIQMSEARAEESAAASNAEPVPASA